jgi:hypothetical protein
MRGNTVRRLGDKNIDLDSLGNLCRNKMSILFPRVVTCEEDVETSNLNEEHGSTEDMTGWVGSDSNGGDGVGSVVVDGLDLRECVQMVLFSINRLCSWIRRSVADPNTVLNKPLVDSFGRVCHKDTTPEVSLRKDVWQGRRMVDMETMAD